jgi:hypothetical protein
MNQNSKTHIAGYRDLVGSALVRILKTHSYNNLLTLTLNGGRFKRPLWGRLQE